MYRKTCPDCGANLDPGEKCDCNKEVKRDNNKTEQNRSVFLNE